MRTGWLLLGICLALAVVLGLILVVPAAPNGRGLPHPEIAGMFVGGDPSRHLELMGLGWVFAMLMSGLCSALLWLGFVTKHRRPGRRRALLFSLPWLPIVFTGLFSSYDRFMVDPASGWWWGLPGATAWMLYGLWLAPLVFVVVYVAGFERWVYGPEEAKRFEALVRGARQRAQRTERPSEGER